MDTESKAGVRLLNAVAACNERLVDLSTRLRLETGVNRALHEFSCRDYKTGPLLEAYVDIELATGEGVCWWLEVEWTTEQWLIRSSLRVSHDQGQDALKEFPDRTARSLEDFVNELEVATSDLVSSADSFDWRGAIRAREWGQR